MESPRVWMAHWREEEGRRRQAELKARELRVRYDPVDAGKLLPRLKADPPDVLIIDLTRSPSQGRDLAVAIRVHGGTLSLIHI